MARKDLASDVHLFLMPKGQWSLELRAQNTASHFPHTDPDHVGDLEGPKVGIYTGEGSRQNSGGWLLWFCSESRAAL